MGYACMSVVLIHAHGISSTFLKHEKIVQSKLELLMSYEAKVWRTKQCMRLTR
jgi:hypothetical protein